MGMIRTLIGLVQMLAAMEEEVESPAGAPTWMTTETRPIEPNDTWSKRAKIRPVEVVVTRNQSLHKLDLDLSTRPAAAPPKDT
tara:strand:+ start:330 stop:578 length:249 start_codon:yes stop_codon:yes gene_type:complete